MNDAGHYLNVQPPSQTVGLYALLTFGSLCILVLAAVLLGYLVKRRAWVTSDGRAITFSSSAFLLFGIAAICKRLLLPLGDWLAVAGFIFASAVLLARILDERHAQRD